MKISIPYVAGEYVQSESSGSFREFITTPEFQQTVTYRRFIFKQNPITGDLDSSNYTDYTIYATVDVQTLDRPLTEAGELEVGDAEIFLSSRIRVETDGTVITPEFRPQINDYVIWKNVTYKIDTITFEKLGSTEMFAKAYGKRMQDTTTSYAEITSEPFVAGEMLEVFREFLTTPEFQQSITYRNFTKSNNPITGDKNTDTYTDYTVYGTVDTKDDTKVLTPAGELITNAVEVFFPSRLSAETDGTAISPQVRPAIGDYLIWDNVTYKISSIIFEIMGDVEIFAKCTCIRMKSDNPVKDWNTSYDSTAFKVGGGYT